MASRTLNGASRPRGARAWPIFGLSLAALLGAAGSASAGGGVALPTGGQVAAGSASIGAANGSSLTINQASTRAVIDWTGFSIGQGGTVQFNNGAGATLNRVTGASASQIDGLLSGTGSVYVLNPNGVIIGKSGEVAVGGTFVASTLNVTDGQFMAGGDLTFSGTSRAAVVNYGKIGALGGDVALIASTVSNAGEIDAANGTAGAIAGYQVVMRDAALDGGKFAVVVGGSGTSVTNSGLIAAANAELRANGGNVYALAGNTAGVIKATGVSANDGKVFLVADNGGTLDVAGAIQARGANGAGGFIETSGSHVSIGAGAIDAGTGGAWLVDPYDLTIDSTAAATIDSTLGLGTNVILQTGAASASGPGIVNASGSGDITVASALSWSTGATLTLDAYHSVAIDANISASGANAGVIIKTNDGGAGGVLSFGPSSSLTFTSGQSETLTINSQAYTLEFTQAALITAMNNTPSGYYAMGSDIAFSGPLTSASYVTSFSGGLEGLGHTLSGLAIAPSSASSNVGLIGTLSGTVADLNLTGVSIADPSGSNTDVGTLAGYSTGTIRNVSAAGSVTATGETNVGGLVGSVVNASPYGVFNSSFSGSVSGANKVGGLVGYANGTISGSWSAGTVTMAGSGAYAGGLVGQNVFQITGSYSTSTVTAGTLSNSVGGLVGASTGGNISDSFASGSVSASSDSRIGGFIGYSTGTTITNSYSTASVSASSGSDVGGFVGLLGGGSIQYTYAAGTISASGGSNVGAFAGDGSAGSITNSVFDTTVGGSIGDAGGSHASLVGETTTQMQDSSAYATNFAGFDFTNTWSPPSSSPPGYYPELYGVSHVVKLTAIDSTMTYGDAVSNLPLSATGLQGADTVGALTGVTYNTSASSSASVGTYSVTPNAATVTGPSGSYRVVVDVPGTITIDPRPVTVTLTGTAEKTYDGSTTATLAAGNFNLANVVPSDTVDIATYTAYYASAEVSANTTLSKGLVTATGLVLGGSSSGNYVLVSSGPISAHIGVIDARTLTPILTSTIEKTYDDTDTASIGTNYTLSNIVAADAGLVTLVTGTGNYDTKHAGVGKTVTFTGLSLTGSKMSDYVLSTTTVTGAVGRIDPLSITAALSGATITKVYDGTTAAALGAGDYAFTGVFLDDQSLVGLSATTGNYDTKDVGTGKTVTFSGLNLTGTLAGNSAGDYKLTTTTLTGAYGEIDKRPLTLALVGTVQKTYDGTLAATLTSSNYLVTNIVAGDTVTLNDPTTGTYATANAGTGIPVSVAGGALAISGADAANYTIASYQLSGLSAPIGIISAAGLTVSLTGTVEKTYDGTTTATLTAANYLFSAPSGVTLNYATTGTYDNANAGSNKMVTVTGLTLGGLNASNYTISPTATGAIGIIDPVALTASLTGVIEKTYDGTTSATLGSNYSLTGVIAADTGTIGLGATSGHYDTKDVGSNKLVTFSVYLTGVHAMDYTIAPTLSGYVGKIDPKAITASLVGTIEKTYDGTTTATLGNHYSFSGVIGSDLSSLGLTATTGNYDTKDVGAHKLVTFSGVSLTGAAYMDYTLSTATLSGNVGQIDPKTITASVSGTVQKTYDGTTTATLGSNYLLNGLIGGDVVTLGATGGSYDTKNAGTSKMVRFNGLSLSGTDAIDYKLSSTSMIGATNGVILQKTVTITLGTIEKTYDATTKATLGTSYTINGLIAGDSVTASAASGAYADKNAGSNKLVTFTGVALGGSGASNYLLNPSYTTLSGTVGKIDPKAVTVSLVGSVSKYYDGTTYASISANNYLTSGLITGDAVSLYKPTSGVYASAAIGTGIKVTVNGLTLTGASAANYQLASTTVSANIGTIKKK